MTTDVPATSMVVATDSTRPLEVIELPNFYREADVLLGREELEAMRVELATLRQLGTIIPGTNGMRKFRVGAKNKGKRGGARVLYFYGGDHMPIFLIAIYAKNEKINVTEPEKKAMRKMIAELERNYRLKRGIPQLKIVLSEKGRRRPWQGRAK